LELGVEELGAAAELAQRQEGVVTDHAAGAGAQRRQLGDQRTGGVLGEPDPDVIGAGQDQGAGLVDGLDPLGAGGALGDHQRADRLHLAIPAFRGTAGAAGLSGTGGADRVERVRFALTPPVLPVRAGHLDHSHARPPPAAVSPGPPRPPNRPPPATPPGPPPPTPPSRPTSGAPPAGRAGTAAPPSGPPIGSSAAATCTSAWVSPPPVMARAG